MVFQKNVCLGTLLDPGGGGLPKPTESTMWGKGSSGRLLRREQKLDTHERCGRTSCSVPTGADGVTRGWFAQYWSKLKLLSRGGGPPGDATYCPDLSWRVPKPDSLAVLVVLWVADPSVPRDHGLMSPSLRRGAWLDCVLCRFADGRIVSLELVIVVREASPSVLSSCPSSFGEGDGEKCSLWAPSSAGSAP